MVTREHTSWVFKKSWWTFSLEDTELESHVSSPFLQGFATMVSSCVMFIQSSHCFWLWFQFLLDEWKQTPIYSPAPVCIAKKSWQCSFFLHLFWVTSIWLYRLCLVDFIAFQARSNFSIPNQHISDTLPLDVQSKDSNQFFRLGRVLRNDWSPNSEIQCTCKHWRNWWTVTSASFTFHSPAPQQSTRKYQRPQTSCWTRHIYNIAMSLAISVSMVRFV